MKINKSIIKKHRKSIQHPENPWIFPRFPSIFHPQQIQLNLRQVAAFHSLVGLAATCTSIGSFVNRGLAGTSMVFSATAIEMLQYVSVYIYMYLYIYIYIYVHIYIV